MYALLVDLWPWVVALYVADGLVQLRRGHLLLTSGGGPLGLLRDGLHLPGLSPLAEAVALHDLPFLAAGGRLWCFDPKRPTELPVVETIDLREVPATAATPVAREGRKVTGAGRLLVVAPTPESAEVSRERLEAAACGRALPASGAFAAARARRAAQAPFLLALRGLASLLAATVFVAWPAIAYGPAPLANAAGPALLVTVTLVLAISALTYWMWRACGEPRRASAATALHLLTYPVAALHPLWHASRSLYARFEPLAVTAALLPLERFAPLAGRELRRATFSRAATPAALAGVWDARIRELDALLQAVGAAREQALAPPARHADAGAWCPLCRVQWRAGFARCDTCGVPLVPFQG